MTLPIRVLGDRVLVLLPDKPHEQEAVTGYTFQPGQTTAAGLILAKPSDTYNVEIATRGIVVQLGEKETRVEIEDVRDALYAKAAEGIPRDVAVADDLCLDECDEALYALAPAPFDVNIGDLVCFSPGAGDLLPFDGHEYLLLYESDLLGVIEPKVEAA